MNKLSSDEDRKDVKKNYRWTLLKRKRNHSKGNSLDLREPKKKNETLYELYLLKEAFLNIFDSSYKTREKAKKMILDWTYAVNKTTLNSLKNFARVTKKRINKMLNWIDCPISNRKAEGINNDIETLLKGVMDINILNV